MARLLAVVQGVIWFTLLSLGSQGLLVGPMAWVATVAGLRHPVVGGFLLAPPVVWLVTSWASILVDSPRVIDWAIFAAVTLPAAVAIGLFLFSARGALSGPSSSPSR